MDDDNGPMRTDWPEGAEVAVSLTFDVDASPAGSGRPRVRAAAEHAQRGALRDHPRPAADPRDPRRHEIKATFYVPGDTAERHTDAIKAIIAAATRSATTATCTCAATRSTPTSSARRSNAGSRRSRPRSASPRSGYRSPELGAHAGDVRAAQGARVRLRQQPDGRRPPVRATTGCSSCPCTGASTTGRTCTGSPAAATRSPRPEAFLATWLAEFESALARPPARHVHDAPRGDRPRLPGAAARRLIDRDDANGPTCGSRRTGMWQPSWWMTFPVHRSDEPTPTSAVRRSGARRPPPVAAHGRRSTAACSPRRTASTSPSGREVQLDAEPEEIDGDRRAARARTRTSCARSTPAPRSSAGRPDECSRGRRRRPARAELGLAPGPARLDRRSGSSSTTRRLVRDADRGRACWPRSASTTPGLGVCLNLLQHDRGRRPRRHADPPPAAADARDLPTPSTRRSSCSPSARTSASSAVTVATPGDVATRRALTRRRERHPRQRRRPHQPLPRAAARAAATSCPTESPSTIPRLEVVRSQPLLDALRSHDGHPKGVCRHVDADEPWVEQTVTVASVVMNLEALRFHVAAGPALHARARQRAHAAAAGFFASARIDSSAVSASVPTITASDSQIGTCQTSTSSIFTPMNARMTARPWVR